MEMAKVLRTTYCISSALFFAACAYVQLNDPDPELWIAAYVNGGCLLSVATIIAPHSEPVNLLTKGFMIVNAVFFVWWVGFLLPRLEYSLLPNVKAFSWSILEFEEGREIGGLWILFLHVLKLLDFQRSGTKRAATRGSSTLYTIAALLMISIAIYLWVNYHPLMNKRYNIEHCSNAFKNSIFSRKEEL